MKSKEWRLASVLTVALLVAAGASGAGAAVESPTGSLTGRVLDQSQAAVPGVAVTATNVGTNETRSTVTNTDGLYMMPALPVGSYSLTVQLDGFKTVKRERVVVEAPADLADGDGVEVREQ